MLSGSPVTITVTRDQPTAGTEITIDSVGPTREGEYANFVVRANPAPANPITVNIGLTTRGDFGANGPSTVTISGETKNYYVGTYDDSQDEAHGSITATVLPGPGYAVGDPASATGVVQDNDDPGAGNPTVTISGGPAITEGQSAAFTLTASPAATTTNPITVNMGVSQTGQFNATGGGSVTITGATASYAIATTGDGVDEDHGSVTATIRSGSGYDVGNPSTATVPVADDDGPAVNVWEREASVTEGGHARFHITTLRDPEDDVTVTLSVTATGDYGVTTGTRTVEFTTVGDNAGFLEFNVGTTYDGVNEADGSITVSVQPGSDYTLGNRPTSTVVVKDFDVPEVNITAGPDVTEGQAATFNVTASPTPWQPLTVDLNVATVGNFGVTAGAQTVTVATNGTGTLSLNTSNDGVAETDGSVTATVQAGQGYTVGATSSASLAVADNDRPIVSLFAGVTNAQDNTNYGEITEGDPVTFTLSADNPTLGWRLNAPLPVTVKVETTGEFGVTAGTYTYTIPVGHPESKTFTIPTTDDQIDDENGSVTLTVLPDSGYTVSSIKSILINVSDDDDPVVGAPEISIQVESFSAQEGESLTFTLTADTAPASPITVNIGAQVTGPADVTSPQTVTLSGTSATFSVSSAENEVSEADSTVGIIVKPGDGYKVGETPYAWFRVKDDDQPVVSVGQGSVNQITEGGNAVFNLSLDRLPHQNLTVSLDITATGDFGVQAHTKTVAVKANQTRVNFSIPTTGDNADEADGAVTATLKRHSSYRMAATARSASITVRDDDEPSGASLSINVAEPRKTVPGGTLVFNVTLDKAVSSDVSVDYTMGHFGQKIVQHLDYSDDAGRWAGTVTIPAGKTATVINVLVSPDIHFDNHDRIYVSLSNLKGAKMSQYWAQGRIVDSLD